MTDYREEEKVEMEQLLRECESLNTLPGPIIQRLLRFKADSLIGNEDREQHLIHYLIESHVPTLRLNVELELDSYVLEKNTDDVIFNRAHLKFSTKNPLSFSETDHDVMLGRITEMPKEWTVVQLTPFFSGEEIVGKPPSSTDGIHITVFNCGSNEEPYCISLLKKYPLLSIEEIKNIKEKIKLYFPQPEGAKSRTLSAKDLKAYHKQKKDIENLLEALVYDLETDWLGPWKCLLIGKFMDVSKEQKIRSLISKFLQEKSLGQVSKKIENMLIQAVKNTPVDKNIKAEADINVILEYCFPGKKLGDVWITFWREQEALTGNEERHPIILIVDESLDALPWEMISTLNKQPCSRMPSLHLLYAIFKVHQNTIVDGYKLIKPRNGKYIINPGLDLQRMEARMKGFFEYWLPEWNGIAGRVPTSSEFKDIITTADIFCYSGHGSGIQYFSSDKIKNERINSVVLLFGCGSTQLVELGPEVEMYWRSQIYLAAACPCVVGMLWIVTDFQTDFLTATFLSYLISNPKKDHWKLIDQSEWHKTGKVIIDNKKSSEETIIQEPNLLKALCMAKEKIDSRSNKSAVVARGIPIKFVNEENS